MHPTHGESAERTPDTLPEVLAALRPRPAEARAYLAAACLLVAGVVADVRGGGPWAAAGPAGAAVLQLLGLRIAGRAAGARPRDLLRWYAPWRSDPRVRHTFLLAVWGVFIPAWWRALLRAARPARRTRP